MVDGLHCLRHYGVIGSDYDDRKVSHLRTAGTHGGKCLMSGSIEECDLLTVRENHVVCSDMLCDTSGLTCDYIRLTDVVEQGSLSVVDVTHHCDYRRSRCEILCIFILLFLLYGLSKLRSYKFNFVSEFFSYKHKRLGVKSLVD